MRRPGFFVILLAGAIALLLCLPLNSIALEEEEQPPGGLRGWWDSAFVRWGGVMQLQYAYDLNDDGQGEDIWDTRFKTSVYLDLKPWPKSKLHLSALGIVAFAGRIPDESVKPEWVQRVPYEAYLLQSLWRIDATIGYLTVKWGTNEFLSPTDNVNPLDMRGFIDPDREDIVIPIPMITARFFITDFIFIEGVAIPFFQPSLFHQFRTDFALCQEGICPVDSSEEVEFAGPEPYEVDWEYGVRFQAQFWDFTAEASYFKTREDFPVYASVRDWSVTYEEIIIQRRYMEYEVVGGGLAWRYKKAALRVEGMYSPERKFTTFTDYFFNITSKLRPIMHPKKTPYYSWAIEAEYNPSRRLYILGAYSEFTMTDPPEDLLISSEYMNLALLMLRATALRERLVFKLGAIYFLQDEEYILAPRIAYQATNRIELSAGVNILEGERADTQTLGGIAPISLYTKNDNAFVGARYNF